MLVVVNGKILNLNRPQILNLEAGGVRCNPYYPPGDWGASALDKMVVQMPSLQTQEVGSIVGSVQEEFFPEQQTRTSPQRNIRRFSARSVRRGRK